jgi:peptidoglycan hydrolase-like protein with peptidoglycan-binding domain
MITGWPAACAAVFAVAAQAQQIGDTVPDAALHGPVYSLGQKPPVVVRGGRPGDEVQRAYIYALQQALPRHGYRSGPATGQLDAATQQAILAYQADAGLSQDAYGVGALKRTLDHITYAQPPVVAAETAQPEPASDTTPAGPTAIHPPEAATPEQAAPPDASVPPEQQAAAPADIPPPGEDTVRLVQERLKAKGYDIDVTGKLDRYTLNAIKVFQASNDLPRDGRIDGYLLDLLKQ